jgi:hypothetical protein
VRVVFLPGYDFEIADVVIGLVEIFVVDVHSRRIAKKSLGNQSMYFSV